MGGTARPRRALGLAACGDDSEAIRVASPSGVNGSDQHLNQAEELARIGTGFVGTPLVCDALLNAGLVDEAYLLLLQECRPSWLYPVSMGATTVWERWDSMLPDGTINPGEMTSFNHYALGAVVDFLQRRARRLAPTPDLGLRSSVVRR